MKRGFFLCAFLLLGCRKTKTEAPDAQQVETRVVNRVVSMSPSTTEALFAIGAGGQTVGRSRYCDYPPAALPLPQVGGYVDPSFEAILALRPDFVTGARGPSGTAMTDRLEARNIATFFPKTETFAEIDEMLLGLGARTGKVTEANAVVTKLHEQIATVERAVTGLPRVRVLLVFGLSPLTVAGPEGFPDELIRRAGGTNAVREGGGYPTLAIERVITLDPDLVINAAMGEPRGSERIHRDTPGWSHVRAAREGHVVAIADESLLRPGPRIGDGLTTLARAIHPEAKIP
jgi:iron complex transport system substrate-binding protein